MSIHGPNRFLISKAYSLVSVAIAIVSDVCQLTYILKRKNSLEVFSSVVHCSMPEKVAVELRCSDVMLYII